jgi:tetratricopeptide (TPR) repeat protein
VETPAPQPKYLNGWVAVNKLMREGNGWSGNERNCCFLNIGQTKFADVAAVTQLDLPDDGRALATTDWNGDGRLDLLLSSRTGPRLRMLRNNVGTDSNFIRVQLIGVECNRDAVGARLVLSLGTKTKRRLIRTLRGGEGFLAQSSKWVHFGLGDETNVGHLEIHWPGGDVQTVTGLAVNQRYVIQHGQSAVSVSDSAAGPMRTETTDESNEVVAPSPDAYPIRIVLSAPLPLPELRYIDETGQETELASTPNRFTLVLLWASWCAPCVRELDELRAHVNDLRDSNLDVIALNVDALEPGSESRESSIVVQRQQETLGLRYGTASESLVRTFDIVQRGLLDQERPLPLPTGFLLDGNQRLTIIYKGPVSPERLLDDVARIRGDSGSLAKMAVPFPGRWHNKLSGPEPILIAMRMIETGDSHGASVYLDTLRERSSTPENEHGSISTRLFLARLLAERNETSQAIATFRQVLQIDPNQVTALVGISHAMLQQKRSAEAVEHLTRALEVDGQQTEAMAYLALARLQQGRTADAVEWYRKALRLRPGWVEVANNLAWILATHSDSEIRNADEAIHLAEQICETTNYQIPGMLDTLAAAYAEAGKYPEAIRTVDRAAAIARDEGQTQMLEKLLSRRQRYESRQPIRISNSD